MSGARLATVTVKKPLASVLSPVNSLSGPPELRRNVSVRASCCSGEGCAGRPCQVRCPTNNVCGVGVDVGVSVAVSDGVLVGVSVGVLVLVKVGVSVGVSVLVLVGVAVGVLVGVFVRVFVRVGVFVDVLVRVGVLVGVAVGWFVGPWGVGVGVEAPGSVIDPM